MIKYLENAGYEVVKHHEDERLNSLTNCEYRKNGHTFEIKPCFVRNGKQNKFFVKMDGETIATRCLLFEAINQMERALHN